MRQGFQVRVSVDFLIIFPGSKRISLVYITGMKDDGALYNEISINSEHYTVIMF